MTRQFAIVPALRYSHVFRGTDALYFGLDDTIWRAGVSLRFSLRM